MPDWISTPNGVVNLEATSSIYLEPINPRDQSYWGAFADGHALKKGTREECAAFIDDLLSTEAVSTIAQRREAHDALFGMEAGAK